MRRYLLPVLLAFQSLTGCVDRAASNRSGVGNPTTADSAARNTTSAGQPLPAPAAGSTDSDSGATPAAGGALPGRGANTRFGAGYSQDNSGSSNGVPKSDSLQKRTQRHAPAPGNRR